MERFVPHHFPLSYLSPCAREFHRCIQPTIHQRTKKKKTDTTWIGKACPSFDLKKRFNLRSLNCPRKFNKTFMPIRTPSSTTSTGRRRRRSATLICLLLIASGCDLRRSLIIVLFLLRRRWRQRLRVRRRLFVVRLLSRSWRRRRSRSRSRARRGRGRRPSPGPLRLYVRRSSGLWLLLLTRVGRDVFAHSFISPVPVAVPLVRLRPLEHDPKCMDASRQVS